MKLDLTSKYILGIVGIVALVAVVVMMMSNTSSSFDISGQAVAARKCTDTDSGFDYTTKGTISGGTWKTTGSTYTAKIDSCNAKGQLQEGFCSDSTHGFYVFKYCESVMGAGYICEDGACVPDTDGDSVPDSTDACSGYDDTDDQDADGIPDGCDDSDDDGIAGILRSMGATEEQIEEIRESMFADPFYASVFVNFWMFTDYDELIVYGTNPNEKDTDGGGQQDVNEIMAGTDPNDGTDDANPESIAPIYEYDSDGDGILDELDTCEGFDDSIDTDSDGIPDGCDT